MVVCNALFVAMEFVHGGIFDMVCGEVYCCFMGTNGTIEEGTYEHKIDTAQFVKFTYL